MASLNLSADPSSVARESHMSVVLARGRVTQYICRLLALLLLICVLSPNAHAQQQPTEGQEHDNSQSTSPFQDQPVISLHEQTPDRVISLARRLIREQNFQAAADILEDLYTRTGSEMFVQVVENLLRTCYDQLKLYDKLELLLRRMIDRTQDNWRERLFLAELLAKKNQRSEARAVYDSVLSEMAQAPDAFERQQYVLRSMINASLDSAALAHIDQARLTKGDRSLFALERGELLESRRKYADAAREYLPILNEDSTANAVMAEKRLLALLQFPESSDKVEELLLTLADSAAGRRTLTLLTDHYLSAGEYHQAFSTALRRDSLMANAGFALLEYMRRCVERKAWAQVARMGDTLFARGVQSRMAPDATFTYGQALEELGRADEAIARYQSLAAGAPHPAIIGDALYAIGVVYADRKHDYTTARAYFDSVVTRYPHGMSFLNAMTALPHCFLKEGHLDSAQAAFERVVARDLTEPADEEVEYYLAMVHFFKKQFDTASFQLQRLMVEHPRGFYVNDALQHQLVMRTAADAPALLYDYSNALLFDYRGLEDSTRVQYRKLIDAENTALADLALYRTALLDMNESDTTAAIEAISLLEQRYPDSYYLPLGLKVKADILIAGDGVEEARVIYRRLLEHFSDYPFASEVREILRRIEAQLAS